MKKTLRNTKGRIINAAWKLFYEQGYDDTIIYTTFCIDFYKKVW